MITWIGAVPALALGALGLLGPGAAIALGWRLRGLAVLLLAAPLTLAVTAVTSIVAPLVGLRWSELPVLALTALLAVAGLALRRRPGRPGRHGPYAPTQTGTRAALGWVAGGVAAAAALAALTFRLGIGRPDAVSQSFDAVFHLNALRYITETGSSSPLDLRGMIGRSGGFYPSLWHACAVLLLPITGGEAPAAANVTALLIAGLLWPLSCVFLVRQLVNPPAVLLGAAAVLSMAFVGFPWFTLSWGVLWPQTLGIALIPAVLACALSVLGVARDDVLGGPGMGGLALGAAVVACGAAHPGALISAFLLASVLALATAVDRVLGWWRRGVLLALGQLVGTVIGLAAVWALLFTTPGVRNTTTNWAATTTVARAVLRHLVGAPNGTAPAYLVSALVLVGAVRALSSRRLWWVVVAQLLSIGVDALAAGTDAPVSQYLTGFWYNDRYRLAAVVPVTGVVLAVVGLGVLAQVVVRLSSSERAKRVLRARLVPTWAAVVVLLGLLGAATGAYGSGTHANFLAIRYLFAENTTPDSLLSTDEQAFLAGPVHQLVPPDVTIAGTPWDGSSLAWAVADRPVLYPYLNQRLTSAQSTIADHLRDVATDPAVCPALRATGVRYALTLGPLFAPPLIFPGGYGGIRDLDAVPGFEKVAGSGTMALYRITACG